MIFSRPARMVGLFITALLGLTTPNFTQLKDCPAILGETGHKVLLDDLREDKTAAESPSEVANFNKQIHFQLKANLDALEADFSDIEPRGFLCEGRWPSEGYLTEDIARVLNARDVVVEVWGSTGLEAGPDGQRHVEARLYYALIPVRRYQGELGSMRSTYDASVSARPGAPLTTHDMEESARRLQVYFTLGAGIQSLENRDYGQALRLMCRSAALIEAGLTPDQSSVDRGLLQRVRALAREVVKRAVYDTDYKNTSGGTLSLLSPEQKLSPCGGPTP